MPTSKMSTWVEKFLWNNIKMYLMQYPSCLCDNILVVKDATADDPIDRYEDFLNSLENHFGLGSYTVQQATQFSNLPYVTVNIAPIDIGHCATRVVLGFDIVFATDTPSNEHTKRETGNSSEATASFRANIMASLDELMYEAFDGGAYKGQFINQAFFDRLRDQTLSSPTNRGGETKPWKYNIVGQVDEEKTITEVAQLKREDRSSGLSVFHVVYKLDINRLYGDGVDCGC